MAHRVFPALLLFVLIAPAACHASGEPAVRAARPMFKGVELYSWVDPATREWRFVLVPGTNRNKTAQKVLAAAGVMRSVRELKARLSTLASGESVVWIESGPAFAIPDRATVDEIVAGGAMQGVTVQVARR
ncbi:hypothetical protein ACFQZQ_10860 [Lysobacter koreensis]|uniref:SPOR domain-containing protein n=1 Tax=Lysobacter koreensis TaxID=266122 RepID=A0ABW2YPI2_9GAMM